MIVWCDGAFASASDVRVSPFDRGLLLGDGVFETFLLAAGVAHRFDAHHRRLVDAAAALAIALPYGPDDIRQAAERLAVVNELERAAVRVTVTRGEGPRGLAPPMAEKARMFITAAAAPAAAAETPAVLALSPVRRASNSISARHKTLSYADNIAALVAARERAPEADDALILDDRGRVSGVSAANIFWVSEGVLFTPSEACAIRPGVTREALLGAARTEGWRAREVEAPLDALLAADEAFVTNSLVGVRAVAKIVA